MHQDIVQQNVWAADPFWCHIDMECEKTRLMFIAHSGNAPDDDLIEAAHLQWWIDNALPAGCA